MYGGIQTRGHRDVWGIDVQGTYRCIVDVYMYG